jgi:probable HAF family extracellular repeat protein
VPQTIAGFSSNAVGINQSGQAIVWGAGGAFWNGASLVRLSLTENTLPNGINDNGAVAGQVLSTQRAFIWTAGDGLVDLGTLPGHDRSVGWGINNAGQVVGVSYTGSGSVQSAFIWENGVMTDLSTLVINGAGWTFGGARSISDTGYITGTALFGGETHAFLLTPAAATTPEPGTWMLSAAGLALVFLAGKRRVTRRLTPSC